MPELPEVETIIRRLREGTSEQKPVPGNKIESVKITWDKIIAEPDSDGFKNNLVGKTITDARRRGKYLHFPLNKGHLIAHLRMSGDMRMERRATANGEPLPQQAYDRVILNFKSPWRLAFSNIRKFGRMWFVSDPQTVFGNLGPEPLADEFTDKMLYEMLHSHCRQVKPLLLDQTFIAGLGNIYTDETLYRSKIHPLRKSDTLKMTEARVLHNSIQSVLKEGIYRFGTSLDWIYRGGEFQNYFRVYQQEGNPCPDCGTPIEKILVGQRSTHLCPHCQEKPGITC